MVHIVGHYELGRTLGEGTFAKVKLAKDTNTQTLYAMKVFSRSEMTGELLAKIKDEVSILKHVRHPNGEPARGASAPTYAQRSSRASGQPARGARVQDARLHRAGTGHRRRAVRQDSHVR